MINQYQEYTIISDIFIQKNIYQKSPSPSPVYDEICSSFTEHVNKSTWS